MVGPSHRSAIPDAHHRLAVGVLLGVVAYILLDARFGRPAQVIAAWDAFVAVDLVLSWWLILRADPAHVRQTVRLQDSSRTVIFVLVLLAACAAFASVAFVLGPLQKTSGAGIGVQVGLSAIAVVGSWLLVHTLFALRYAHIYYGRTRSAGDDGIHGGLLFPGTPKPGYLDFAYFSFVIGMTSQVSDVQVSSQPLRRLALLHGVLSFAFNVVIIGLTISAMAGLM